MVAILLVGGQGTRLRPLTNSCPKPLVPVANVPFMSRRLRYLGRQGVGQSILAVQYLADRFRAAYRGSSVQGMRVEVIEEPEPLGTAGAARYALQQHPLAPGEPVLIFNGDLLTDLASEQLVAFHRQAGAIATIAVAEVADPRSCGVVVADAAGRVSAFQEKPEPGSELARTVNSGAYVLEPAAFEYVRREGLLSFEHDLFPELLERGLPVAAFKHSALWLDIGTLEGYLAANAAVLEGRMRDEPLPGRQVRRQLWIGAGVSIDPTARLQGPIVLGDGVKVEAGAQLIGPLAIGAGTHIGAEALVERSVLWDAVSVGASARISSAALASQASIMPGAQIARVAHE